MVSRFCFWAPLLKGLTAICVVGLLIGCGARPDSPINSTPSPTPTSTTTLSSTQNSTEPPPYTVKSIGFDLTGVFHIQSHGIICQPGALIGKLTSIFVLATDRLDYDTGEIQQMANYIDAVLGHSAVPSSPPIPATFNPVSVGPVTAFSTYISKGNCQGTLEITNIGDTTVQLAQVSMQLTAAPVPNRYQYRLIDICSLPTHVCPIGLGGGVKTIDYDFHLRAGQAHTVLQAQSDTPVIINPDQPPVGLFLSFESSSTPGNFIYSVVPQITVNTQDQQTTYTLPQLSTTLAFADAKQFACYSLKGNTLVLLDQKALQGTFCL
jgi:hypothetical protein